MSFYTYAYYISIKWQVMSIDLFFGISTLLDKIYWNKPAFTPNSKLNLTVVSPTNFPNPVSLEKNANYSADEKTLIH